MKTLDEITNVTKQEAQTVCRSYEVLTALATLVNTLDPDIY